MTISRMTRRTLATTGAAALLSASTGLLSPARAAGLSPTLSMRGGSNNYRPGAPIVERIGGGGFWMTGTVRRAGDGTPLPGQRIQIWAHTTEGHERDWHSHGATLTDANGEFRLEMPQIMPTGKKITISVSRKRTPSAPLLPEIRKNAPEINSQITLSAAAVSSIPLNPRVTSPGRAGIGLGLGRGSFCCVMAGVRPIRCIRSSALRRICRHPVCGPRHCRLRLC